MRFGQAWDTQGMNAKKAMFAVLGLAGALSLAACGDTTIVTGQPTPNDSSSISGSVAPAQSNVEAAIAAITLAEQHAKGTAVELDDSDTGGWVVDVTSNNQVTEVIVNAEGTEVVGTRSDGRLDRDTRGELEDAKITIVDAINKASAEATGLIIGVDLDRRFRTAVWDVEFLDGGVETTVSIDAKTGEVNNVETDRDD